MNAVGGPPSIQLNAGTSEVFRQSSDYRSSINTDVGKIIQSQNDFLDAALAVNSQLASETLKQVRNVVEAESESDSERDEEVATE